MMLLSDSGIAYAEGFYKLENGRIFNTFTNRSLGVLIRKIPSSSYLSMDKITKPCLFVTVSLWIVGVLEGLRYSLKRKSEEEEKFFLEQSEFFFKERR